MKIIVFGASGDTGTYFIKYLFENGFTKENEVIAVGTRKTTKFELYKIEYLQLDITQKNEFEKLPQSVDAVVDLAGMMPARMKGYEPQRYIDVNITGTLNILDYCRSANADRILLWGDRIFEKCGIRRDEGGDGGKTLEIRGKRRLSARDGGANYQQS